MFGLDGNHSYSPHAKPIRTTLALDHNFRKCESKTLTSQMVIDIIGITKQKTGSSNYPPAVIAMLVAAILQMLHHVYLVATSGRGFLGKATNVMAASAFFFVFQVGTLFPPFSEV